MSETETPQNEMFCGVSCFDVLNENNRIIINLRARLQDNKTEKLLRFVLVSSHIVLIESENFVLYSN
ncbi:hypothetical protein MCG98_18140 [Ruminococcus sp. OA3]|uniref:hypothetical protein n=1 Tax=Ruminococcus sp. OA3 TaxID=2914164 RepID=UPI001F061911|nr:hypothetical protein [Ruminococcus sp. OA3]MCH1984476.1 hypothetical protein [Ruminococcus sp. OA3]